ncbi:MAG: hypothetical protein KGL45_00730 [Gammaproteobacteria bacterium]|nr:hypothetical protein [Gammaproteobacteria bacterium]MDE2261027.1 hypothetical protein [Gammaproteobacteria bacterium]
MSNVIACVDAHVHLHSCYDPDDLLQNAYDNLAAASDGVERAGARAYFLLLAECASDDCFGALCALAGRQPASSSAFGLRLRRWAVAPTGETISVVARDGQRELFIVAGRQVACREGLEVLVLGTTHRFADGRPIRDVLRESDALAVPRVIPWGPGKWFFRRGRLLEALIAEFRKPTLFLGDEGGRPVFWGYPQHFARAARLGVRDLPGTDPLPFPHDVHKVGRMGFKVAVDLDPARPGESLLRSLIQAQAPLERFATLEPPLRFVRNQIGMQLRKRLRA